MKWIKDTDEVTKGPSRVINSHFTQDLLKAFRVHESKRSEVLDSMIFESYKIKSNIS